MVAPWRAYTSDFLLSIVRVRHKRSIDGSRCRTDRRRGSSRLIADAGLVFTNVCFQTGAAIRGEICNAIVSLHDNPTDAPSVSGLAD